MKSWTVDIAIIALLIGAGLVGGYFVGKNSVKTEEKTVVEYLDLPTVQVSVQPKLLNVPVPEAPQFLFFTDTITSRQVVDTVAILADWVLKREYGGRLIEDSTGTVDYSAMVQYNRLQNLSLDYTPLQRTATTTITKQPRWAITGGVGVGWTTAGIQPHLGVTVGYVIWSK